MCSVIFSRSYGIKEFIVCLYKVCPSLRVSEYPVLKGFPKSFLLLTGKSSLFLIKHTLFLAILDYSVEDTTILQIKAIFKYFISVCSFCSISRIDKYIVSICIFTLYIPCTRNIRILNAYKRAASIVISCQIFRCLKGFLHKLVNIFRIYPCCTDTHFYLACIKLLWHNTL